MSPQDLFGVVIRSAGILFIGAAGMYFYSFLYVLFIEDDETYSAATYLISVLFCGLIGFYCLKGAPHLMRIAYPPVDSAQSDETST